MIEVKRKYKIIKDLLFLITIPLIFTIIIRVLLVSYFYYSFKEHEIFLKWTYLAYPFDINNAEMGKSFLIVFLHFGFALIPSFISLTLTKINNEFYLEWHFLQKKQLDKIILLELQKSFVFSLILEIITIIILNCFFDLSLQISIRYVLFQMLTLLTNLLVVQFIEQAVGWDYKIIWLMYIFSIYIFVSVFNNNWIKVLGGLYPIMSLRFEQKSLYIISICNISLIFILYKLCINQKKKKDYLGG